MFNIIHYCGAKVKAVSVYCQIFKIFIFKKIIITSLINHSLMKQRLFVLNLIILLPVFLICQNRYDVLIDEIMADPTPQVGLPNHEWIELKNVSSATIDLAGWRLTDASGQSGPMPSYLLSPGNFVIICTGNAIANLSLFGPCISVTSFPSLDNAGDKLALKSPSGTIIHAVEYDLSWYRNAIKENGGWTLEMIDPQNPCSGAGNWTASTDPTGGTPGKKNAADAFNADNEGPSALRALVTNDTTILIIFNEPLDSLSGTFPVNFSLDGSITVLTASSVPPLFNEVEIRVSPALEQNKIYTLTARNIKDCSGNTIGVQHTVRVGIPEIPGQLDLVINEILFNPRSGGSDYAEFFNRSNKIIDVSRLYIANRNSSGAISSQQLVSARPSYIFPGDYFVITEDLPALQLDYLVKDPGAVIPVSSLPSYPDNEGILVLLNYQGDIIDELHYYDDWHFKLIQNTEGVSLERIDPETKTQEVLNWHSAASTAGYGTPGYENSQYSRAASREAILSISPKIFSPDNDGLDDIATIRYAVDEPGYVANITIYDAAGRTVRNLVRNDIMGLEGNWHWDGLDEKGQQLPIGNYIILTEIFNLQGQKKKFKQSVVLARKLG
ncbi:MAG: hypothetical protein GC171_15890 [Terrimonas sp.]|nr:hypothetical protein [Terrimonas sp.]